MANQTLVGAVINMLLSVFRTLHQASPSKLIYDPFVGTGSMAYVPGVPLPFT